MQSSLSSPFSVGMKLLFTPWTVLIVGNNLFIPGICKTIKTSSIRHLFGLVGWVGGSPPILSLFGFSEMSDNCRPPLMLLCFVNACVINNRFWQKIVTFFSTPNYPERNFKLKCSRPIPVMSLFIKIAKTFQFLGIFCKRTAEIFFFCQ